MSNELAKAYVQIVPSAEGIKGKISEALGGEAESAGKSAGLNIAGAIKNAIAAAGIGAAVKAALNEGAALQQSIGGVETLFKGSADTVKRYADEAYKSAGLSANAYMETVTGFSASLLQSLGGDTDAAAEAANKAIVAMSDNANKMGTDMQSIQNAYQGFAKQNYTMLDNLKLGYGGTKQEMERLLSDAEALSGMHYELDNLSDVYSAIQVIQDNFENTPLSALVVFKYDSVTGEAVKNAVFQVKYLSGTSGTGGTVIGTYLTSANGSFTVTGLEAGTYIVEELASDSGHVIDVAPQTAYISGEPQSVVQLYFGNAPKGSLIIRKLDSITKAPLGGAEFSVRYADGRVVDNAGGKLSSNGIYTTNSNGEIVITGLTGTVVVTEEKAPDGYLLDANGKTQTVVVNADDTQTLVFYDTPIGGLIITKSDDETGARISGVQFEVQKMNGEIVGQYATDRNGTIRLPGLDSGWYTVTELKAASGYQLDPTPQQVEVKDGQTATLALTNRKTSRILLHKIDADTGKGIYGAVFVLYDSNRNPIGEYTSDQDGYVYMDDGLADGRYYVREIKAADGYVLDTELKTIYVRYGATSEITWKNVAIRGQIQIVKKSANDNPINGLPAGTLLEGAVFEITDKAGTIVDTIKTDRNGRAASKLLPLSRYTVKEVAAPNYYAINPTVFNAYLEHEGQIVNFEVLDESIATGVAIKKTGYVHKPPADYSLPDLPYQFTSLDDIEIIELEESEHEHEE